jgi:TIR domain
MSSLADLPDLVGFFSYSRSDDKNSDGGLTLLRERISKELRLQLGHELRLWQDKEAIPFGTLWADEVKRAIAESAFFIPIVSLSAVNSRHCRMEFEGFLAREAEFGRSDLVFPILYIPVPGLANADQRGRDEVLKIVHARQYANWTEMRLMDLASSGFRSRRGNGSARTKRRRGGGRIMPTRNAVTRNQRSLVLSASRWDRRRSRETIARRLMRK